MRTNAMGTSRGPIARDAKPAGVKAGTTSLLWALLARPNAAEQIRHWFSLPPARREAIAAEFVDEFALAGELDVEIRLDLTVDFLDLASGLPPCELTDIAETLEPTVAPLALRCDMRTILEEVDSGRWRPQPNPASVPIAPAAALHAPA